MATLRFWSFASIAAENEQYFLNQWINLIFLMLQENLILNKSNAVNIYVTADFCMWLFNVFCSFKLSSL